METNLAINRRGKLKNSRVFLKLFFIFAARCMTHSHCVTNSLFALLLISLGTAVAQWLRCCATNRKVVGSIPAGVSGFFVDIKSF